MPHPPQLRIPATYMRGGTSKGVFFRLEDLPERARGPGPARDALLMRVIGSPDPYGKHTDGMGGATSSTSKCVIISKSTQPGHDVDYLYGQVAIDTAFVDWSGNCGNLSAAVGPFAIAHGFLDPARVPDNGICTVRIWQANIRKTIIAQVPVTGGQVQETGDFELDGVTFPAAEIVLEFLDPAEDDGDGGSMFPTGNRVDDLDVPGIGSLKATMINAGIPTIFVNAADLGLNGTELQPEINGMASFRIAWKDWPAFRAARDAVPEADRRAAMARYLADPRDTATAVGMLNFLRKLAVGELLSRASTRRLLAIMTATTTGPNRLKAGLPAGASLAHKTGTSATDLGLTAVTNDVGIVTLKDGRRYAVVAFLAASPQDEDARERTIADAMRVIVKAAG